MEWLASISIKWVLVGVGVLVLALTAVRLSGEEQDASLGWITENVQVVLSVVVVVFLVIRPFLFQAFYIPSGSMRPTLHDPQGGAPGDRLLVNKLIYVVANPRRYDIAVFKAPKRASPQEKEFIKRVIGLPGETVEVVPPRLLVDGRTAMVLTSESSSGLASGLNLTTRPSISPQGSTASLDVLYPGSLKVFTHPAPRIRQDAYRVALNGRKLLEDPEGRIQELQGVRGYGGDPRLKSTVYTLDNEPRIVIVAGRKLTYESGHVKVNGNRLHEDYVAEPPHYAMRPLKLGPRQYFMMGDNRNNSEDSHRWGALPRDRMIGRAEVIFWPLNRFRVLQWWLLSALGGLFAGYEILQRLLRSASAMRREARDVRPSPSAGR